MKNVDYPGENKQGSALMNKEFSVLKIIRGMDCNYNCRFCLEQTASSEQNDFIKQNRSINYTQVRLESAMLYARDVLKIKEINFSGGEPLVNQPQALSEEISSARRIGFPQITILTNGSLLTPQLIDSYTDAGLTNLSVSLHTGDSTNYDYLTRSKDRMNHHQHVVDMINYATQNTPLRVRINVAKTKDYTEGIPELIKLAEDISVQEMTINEMIKANRFSTEQFETISDDMIPGYELIKELPWGLSLFKEEKGRDLSIAICRFGGENFVKEQTKDVYFLPNGVLSPNLFDKTNGIMI
jgi:molybdenum cofactor biosynthesis enzyme MoaA